MRIQCDPADLSQQMSIALPEVMMHLSSVGAEITGPPFSRYHAVGDRMDFECGMPVSEPIEPSGRIENVTLPGGYVVTAWHVGPYHELGDSHDAMMAWMEEREIEATGPIWEVYWTDPGLEPDPAKWRHAALRPLRPSLNDPNLVHPSRIAPFARRALRDPGRMNQVRVCAFVKKSV